MEERLKTQVIELVAQSEIPVDINYIATTLGIHWFTAYRLVTEIILEELQKHPNMLQYFPFMLLKSTKSLVIVPNKLLPIKKVRRT